MTTTSKCGNETCPCAKTCECPFGACTCAAELEESEPSVNLAQEPDVNPPDGANLELLSLNKTSEEKVLNINIGVIGHVNSGKTSLVRALSKTLSTAALDKNPQSRERGMTLDLGFSSFALRPTNALLKSSPIVYDKVQYTLVDCPGHAQLIRTIIGGAQIIDRALLVVDATKGMQTQTAECLVIAEILTDDLLVVFNKIDLFPEATRAEDLRKSQAAFRAQLQNTKFADAPFVAISAFVNGDAGDANETVTAADFSKLPTINLVELVRAIQDSTRVPPRNDKEGPVYFSVDHCFQIKGQGTVLTGTMLSGRIRVGDEIEIANTATTRKIKSIERFRNPVSLLEQGDRGALCVTNLDAGKIERGAAFTPGSMRRSRSLVALVRRVRYFARPCATGSKLHVTVGSTTALASVTFFGGNQLRELAKRHVGKALPDNRGGELDAMLRRLSNEGGGFEADRELRRGGKEWGGPVLQFAVIEFEHSLVIPSNAQLIASRLDADQAAPECRIAFYGRVAHVVGVSGSLGEEPPPGSGVSTGVVEPLIRLYRNKRRVGTVDRVERRSAAAGKKTAVAATTNNNNDVESLIGKNLFKKSADVTPFLNMKVFVTAKEGGTGAHQSENEERVGENDAEEGDDEENDDDDEDDDEKSEDHHRLREGKSQTGEPGIMESPFGMGGKFKVVFRGGNGSARPGDKLVLSYRKYTNLYEISTGLGPTLGGVLLSHAKMKSSHHAQISALAKCVQDKEKRNVVQIV